MAAENSQGRSFTVAFDEADSEGIVFFGNYFRLAHRALEQFLPLRKIPWAEWFTNKDWGVPLRHVEAEYFRSLRPGDTFSVQIQVAKVGTSSVQFTYDFRDEQGEASALLKTSHVFVNRQTRQKISIPESIRLRLVP